jgi:hypothetical protein
MTTTDIVAVVMIGVAFAAAAVAEYARRRIGPERRRIESARRMVRSGSIS